MQRSVAKILTTHVGSLPFLSLDKGVAIGDESHLADDVAAIVARQREIGIDIINEGEYAKGGDWLRYMQNRFGGFTEIAVGDEKPLIERGKDREQFADFYKYATERGTLFYSPGAQIAKKRPVQACTGPVTYVGQAELKKEIDVTLAVAGTDNVFLTSTAPGSLEVYRRNRHYKNDEEYVFALAEAMRVEYEAIAAAGLILQVDDAWLPARTASAWTWGYPPFALAARCGSKRSIMRCATFRKIACAIICAGAAGTARTPTIS
ncbi:MAG: hypothetical protein WAR76_12590, partial [Xanthobacteraceae bacterium]